MLISILLMFLANCTAETKSETSLYLTPDKNHPTATPFQPNDGTFSSPYGSSNSSSPTRAADGSSNFPSQMSTPFPSGYELPIFFPSTNTNPLTGQIVQNPENLERRPLAIKITQFPRYVRPQSGLTLADVVFEYYIEDGLTRFIAIFYGNNAKMVGPVRSGRFFDEHVVRMYQAFYVFKYADPRVYTFYKESNLKNYLIVPGNGSCPPFVVGKSERDTYNNIFLNTFKFNECIAKRKSVDNDRPAVRGQFFSNIPPTSSQPAERIFTQYSLDDYNYWEYLPEVNRYQRYQEVNSLRNGSSASYALLTDALSNLPVQADNVVVLYVPHRFANKNQEEDEVYHIDLLGSGKAYVFRDGNVVQATWNRIQVDQPLLLISSTGAPIYLKPGITFYQVVGTTSGSWHDSSDWHFTFDTP